MRLLKCDQNGALSITSDLLDREIPQYAIVSHTWGVASEEVTLQDYQAQETQHLERKAGYGKILFCSGQAARDDYQFLWIDTCCIDKTNHVELSEAINSMFRWYREAATCYVFLSDVTVGQSDYDTWQEDFRKSKWFTRGWTLQELLAPRKVEFFSSDGIRLGDKASLEHDIHVATGIAVDALRGRPLADFSVSERMSWAAKRETTRKEDEAYSLLGIFDIFMPLIYGERERAFVRLHDEIDKSLQGTSLMSNSAFNSSGTPASLQHPVKKNYRKVHVTILHWESDQLQDTVQRISDTFRSLYHYEVREILLPRREKVKVHWPWIGATLVDDRDLQIIYYLGNTVQNEAYDGGSGLKIVACPIRQSFDQEIDLEVPNLSVEWNPLGFLEKDFDPLWLDDVIYEPALNSDVFIVLDCVVESLVTSDNFENIRFRSDRYNPWPRYLVLLAGYTMSTIIPGMLSERLVSLLTELKTSNKFYAREGLITTGLIRERLEKAVRFDDEMDLIWAGNDGRNLIHLSPLPKPADTWS